MRRKGNDRPASVAKSSGLTFLGLGIAALGWALLIGGLLVSDATLRAGSLVAGMTARSDVVTVAQSAIVTGLALAIIGALRSGFGAFGRFFDAVLQRSSTPKPQAVSETREPEVSIPSAERGAGPPMPPPPLRNRQKNYVILPDGSVEVETMFGTRVFATLDEASEFIR